jgi:hypothetical protein
MQKEKLIMATGSKGTKHVGFKAAAKKIARKQGVSEDSASAILAASTRRASKSAREANSHLNRVSS